MATARATGKVGTKSASQSMATILTNLEDDAATNDSLTVQVGGIEGTTTEPSFGPVCVTLVVEASTENEIQTISITPAYTGSDTFKLSLDSGANFTVDIDETANAATMVTALEGLPQIGSGDVGVTGGGGSAWVITFQGDLADTDMAILEATEVSDTTGSSIAVVETNKGVSIDTAGATAWDDVLSGHDVALLPGHSRVITTV